MSDLTQRSLHDLTALAGAIPNATSESSQSLVDELEKEANISSTHRFRVFEVIVKLACSSKENLAAISEAKFHLSSKISSYLQDKSDVLSKLNCVEILDDLVDSEHGFDFLDQNMHLHQLSDYLKVNKDLSATGSSDVSMETAYLLPAVVRFFAHAARSHPAKIRASYSVFFAFIFRSIADDKLTQDTQKLNFTLETFVYLLEDNRMQKFLCDHYEVEFDALIKRLVSIFQSCINEKAKTNVTECIAQLIAADPSVLRSSQSDTKLAQSIWMTDEWISMAEQFFKKISLAFGGHEKLFSSYLTIARQPFVEARLAAQLYFLALSQTSWGVTILFTPNKFNSFDQFVEGYLLDRSIEVEKQGLESKYELNKLLLAKFKSDSSLVHLIGDNGLIKLRGYVQEGPFFPISQTVVAFEKQ